MNGRCDHCGKKLTDAGNELPHPDPKMRCVAFVCDDCYLAGVANALTALHVLRSKYEQLLEGINARIRQLDPPKPSDIARGNGPCTR